MILVKTAMIMHSLIRKMQIENSIILRRYDHITNQSTCLITLFFVMKIVVMPIIKSLIFT